ncbi:hypothetical protein C7M84_007843 [Penaeus vannamei]|uniref:Uncharacterized protein n=1 Tax=Penaeus vannamei TaxID=6689 RepID=A0A423TB94_PENVA|nr:hypothetical protein C7M84_007843 [Penaeus vannamei]
MPHLAPTATAGLQNSINCNTLLIPALAQPWGFPPISYALAANLAASHSDVYTISWKWELHHTCSRKLRNHIQTGLLPALPPNGMQCAVTGFPSAGPAPSSPKGSPVGRKQVSAAREGVSTPIPYANIASPAIDEHIKIDFPRFSLSVASPYFNYISRLPKLHISPPAAAPQLPPRRRVPPARPILTRQSNANVLDSCIHISQSPSNVSIPIYDLRFFSSAPRPDVSSICADSKSHAHFHHRNRCDCYTESGPPRRRPFTTRRLAGTGVRLQYSLSSPCFFGGRDVGVGVPLLSRRAPTTQKGRDQTPYKYFVEHTFHNDSASSLQRTRCSCRPSPVTQLNHITYKTLLATPTHHPHTPPTLPQTASTFRIMHFKPKFLFHHPDTRPYRPFTRL